MIHVSTSCEGPDSRGNRIPATPNGLFLALRRGRRLLGLLGADSTPLGSTQPDRGAGCQTRARGYTLDGCSSHFSEGTTPDGGRWEHFDDGYYWWYKRWDSEGTLVEDESGYHHMSGGSGFQLGRGTITDGQDDAAPLNDLQGGRADYGVAQTGDMDGDGTADHLDRDMDGDGIPDDRDSDKNGNGIRDWEEEQQARRQNRAARKLFNEFWTGLSDIDRQQWRKDYANGKLDMLEAFLEDKLKDSVEQSQVFFSVSDDAATEAAETSLLLNIGTTFDPQWYVISVTANPSANFVIDGIAIGDIPFFLALVEAGAQLQQQIWGLSEEVTYYEEPYWFETYGYFWVNYRKKKIFELKEEIARLEEELKNLGELFNEVGFGGFLVSGRPRNPTPDDHLPRLSGKGFSAAINAMMLSFENGGGEGASQDYPIENTIAFVGEWVLFGRLLRAALSSRVGGQFFDDLARHSTRNPESRTVVLGKWLQEGKSYTKVAAHYRASYLKLANWRALTKSLTQDELWRINKAFLDQQIRAGKRIILSHDPSRATGFFLREVNYLRDLGYRFVQDGWVWRAVK